MESMIVHLITDVINKSVHLVINCHFLYRMRD